MNSLNSILVEGNLVRDPELRETSKGSSVCCFSIASNRFYKQDDDYEQETSFFEVESWAKLAETCAKTLQKGRGVRVVGRLKQDRWTGPDGKQYSKIKVVAEHIEFKPRFKGKPDGGAESDDSAASEAASSLALAAGAEFDTIPAPDSSIAF